MKEEIAFELEKNLVKKGYPVAKTHHPKTGQAGLTGEEGMTFKKVKECTDIVRETMLREKSQYTIETVADKHRVFPDTSFAAW